VINAALITGLDDPEGVAVVPEPRNLVLLGWTLGIIAFGASIRGRHRQQVAELATPSVFSDPNNR
jgi:hypothetical protein